MKSAEDDPAQSAEPTSGSPEAADSALDPYVDEDAPLDDEVPHQTLQGFDYDGFEPVAGVEASDASARSGRRRRSGRSWKRKYDKAKRAIRVYQVALGLLSIATCVIVVAAGLDHVSGRDDAVQLRIELAENARARAALEKTVESQASKIEALVSRRVPGLKELRLDEVGLVDDPPYVRNISFARVGSEKEERYEFRLLLENRDRDLVLPNLDIILFDGLGFEIDRHSLRAFTDEPLAGTGGLLRGETRSYAGSFVIPKGTTPAYYLVRAR